MKVKEALSKDYLNETEDDIVLLKVEKDLALFEVQSSSKGMTYSKYYIKKLNDNIVFFEIDIPKPEKIEIYKDIFLKYQTGAKMFLSTFFDCLVGNTKEMGTGYKTKQKKDLKYEKIYNGSVVLRLLDDKNTFFGFIDFPKKEINLKIAKNFINFFEGIPLEYSWEEICEQ